MGKGDRLTSCRGYPGSIACWPVIHTQSLQGSHVANVLWIFIEAHFMSWVQWYRRRNIIINSYCIGSFSHSSCASTNLFMVQKRCRNPPRPHSLMRLFFTSVNKSLVKKERISTNDMDRKMQAEMRQARGTFLIRFYFCYSQGVTQDSTIRIHSHSFAKIRVLIRMIRLTEKCIPAPLYALPSVL
jgi:hypothetical protein